MKIWLVEFPTYRYTQDVKKLARAKNLKIIDKRFSKGINPEIVASATEAPKLTLKPEFQPKEIPQT